MDRVLGEPTVRITLLWIRFASHSPEANERVMTMGRQPRSSSPFANPRNRSDAVGQQLQGGK